MRDTISVLRWALSGLGAGLGLDVVRADEAGGRRVSRTVRHSTGGGAEAVAQLPSARSTEGMFWAY